MRLKKLDQIASTFHDFDLVDIYLNDSDLIMEFKCFWNEMNDKSNPWMTFEFVFPNAELISYELFENGSEKKIYQNINDQKLDFKPLIDSDVYVNSFDYQDRCYVFHCLPNQDIYAVIRIRFNSDSIKIRKDKLADMKLQEYLKLYNSWWDFVKN